MLCASRNTVAAGAIAVANAQQMKLNFRTARLENEFAQCPQVVIFVALQ